MISIIVPVYNVIEYLPQCLDSLIGQSYKDLEIICVDDGSSDGSSELLDQYALKDSRIKVFHQKNCGVSEARNVALQFIHGEWLMFVDSDDWLDLDCCEKLMKQSEKDADLYFFPYIREYKKSSLRKDILLDEPDVYTEKGCEQLFIRLIAPIEKGYLHPDKLNSFTTLWSKMYKTNIVKEHHISFVSLKELGTGEDLLFNVQYFRWIKKGVALKDTFYHYRKSISGSVTKLYKPNLDKQWNSLLESIEFEIKDRTDLLLALKYRRALSVIGLGLNITFSTMSFCMQKKALSNIIENQSYHEALSVTPLKGMPFHWKVFFSFCYYKFTSLVLLLLRVINKIVTR